MRPDAPDGTCDARVFTEPDELFLFGAWHEAGKSWVWWAELERETP